ncbi:alpha/beta fold hydrolase [Streptomyces sp. NPDC001777]|uniref:alpha/beta fold hydrolase n=1 Tax=Streptomyces sp. NPDC001777 TaxID=3364608 RepID=UPI00369616E3
MTGEMLHVRTFGDVTGSPVVAVHGVYGYGGRWRGLAAEHLAGFRVHAPDLRGQGRSSWSPPWTLEQHVADLVATMDGLGLRRADLLGFSFGAAVSLHLARHAPERLRRLVLLDPAIGLGTEAAARSSEKALAAPSFLDPAEARAAYAKSWPSVPRSGLDEEIADYLVRGEDGRWRWRFEPESIAAAYTEMARPPVLPPSGVPTLLVRAARSDVVNPEYLAACRAAGVEATEVDSGHQLLLERPAETGALVREFLDAPGLL